MVGASDAGQATFQQYLLNPADGPEHSALDPAAATALRQLQELALKAAKKKSAGSKECEGERKVRGDRQKNARASYRTRFFFCSLSRSGTFCFLSLSLSLAQER